MSLSQGRRYLHFFLDVVVQQHVRFDAVRQGHHHRMQRPSLRNLLLGFFIPTFFALEEDSFERRHYSRLRRERENAGLRAREGVSAPKLGGNRQYPLLSAPPARPSVLTAQFYQSQPPRGQAGFRATNPRVRDLPLKTPFPQYVARMQVPISTFYQNGMVFAPKVTTANLAVKKKYKYIFRLRGGRVSEAMATCKTAGFLLTSVQFYISPKHLGDEGLQKEKAEMLPTSLRSYGRPPNLSTQPRRWPPLGKTSLCGSQTIECLVWKNIGANRSPGGGSVHTRAPSYRGSITTVLLPPIFYRVAGVDSPGILHAQGPPWHSRPVVDPHQAPHQPARWLNDQERVQTSPIPSLAGQTEVLKWADPMLGIDRFVES